MQLQVWRSRSRGTREQPKQKGRRQKEKKRMKYKKKNNRDKDRVKYSSHFDAGLPPSCRPSSSAKTRSPGIWDSGKPTLLWTMTQGANFKYADWSISSISQSRRWSSFSLPVSLFCVPYCALPYSPNSYFISSPPSFLPRSPHWVYFPLTFSLGQIRAGCCPSCQDPCLGIQKARVKIGAISFPRDRDTMHIYYLTERTRAMEVNKACFM